MWDTGDGKSMFNAFMCYCNYPSFITGSLAIERKGNNGTLFNKIHNINMEKIHVYMYRLWLL